MAKSERHYKTVALAFGTAVRLAKMLGWSRDDAKWYLDVAWAIVTPATEEELSP